MSYDPFAGLQHPGGESRDTPRNPETVPVNLYVFTMMMVIWHPAPEACLKARIGLTNLSSDYQDGVLTNMTAPERQVTVKGQKFLDFLASIPPGVSWDEHAKNFLEAEAKALGLIPGDAQRSPEPTQSLLR